MLNSLKRRNILTIHDIEGYRKDIAQTLSDSDKVTRARALSSVVNRQLDSCLYGIEIPKRAAIKRQILSDFTLTYEPVTYQVVMEKIIEVSDEHQLVPYLSRWLQLSAGVRIPESTLYTTIRELKQNLKKEVVLSTLGHVSSTTPDPDDLLPDAFFSSGSFEALQPLYRIRKSVLLFYIVVILGAGFAVHEFMEFSQGLSLPKFSVHLPFFADHRLSFTKGREVLEIDIEDPMPELHEVVLSVYNADNDGIPSYLRYCDFDREKLRDYLKSKNSLLTEPAYFNTIIRTAKRHDLNPLLLFAICGQEQAFVPRSSKYLTKVINNPYNVYTSWKNYNTSLRDSTNIASGTLVEILEKRPKGQDPFKWINARYAEDRNWWRGTKIIFQRLTNMTLLETQ